MSSSQAFASSSPVSPNAPRRRRRSKFTYKHLSALAQSAPGCPLRVIAHIDLDAFYAQCETVRLGIDPGLPLAVQQWQGLIAINYPARAFGLTRHVTISEAKEKCPELICQHVATWKEGDAQWSYSDDASREIATRKVSLDPYRKQSRRILALIKARLPADLQRVEKASVDEVFVDLSAQIHHELLKRHPVLRDPAPYDDPTESLPRPPTTALDWAADALVDLDSSQTEEDDPDWDDVAMLIGSEVVRDVRRQIFEELHYTCSAGLGRNKMLAKLGSGNRKPNGQTVVRNRAVQHFLSGFKFTKIRNLGGKLGDEIVAAFNTDAVSDLLPVPLEQLKKQLGDETGSWLYGTLRGEDASEVNPRTAIKSMLSAKSFRPSVNDFDVACKWLRIFVADIHSRLVEEGVLENKRRPKTMNLHHRQGAQTRSKQVPIPMGRTLTEEGLFELAKNLLAQVIVDGRAWPCSNLSLSVGGFEDGVSGNKGIGGFLVRGEEAKALNAHYYSRDGSTPPPSKRRRAAGDSSGITRFFGAPAKQQSLEQGDTVHDENDDDDQLGEEKEGEENDNDVHEDENVTNVHHEFDPRSSPAAQSAQRLSPCRPLHSGKPPFFVSSTTDTDDHSPSSGPAHGTIETYFCPRCASQIPTAEKSEHDDFHFAQDLQDKGSSPPPDLLAQSKPKQQHQYQQHNVKGRGAGGGGRGRPPSIRGSGGGVEKGQQKLAFG